MIRRKNALFSHFHGKVAKLKIVPAITDFCTGGQQCKYQLLDSGVNISYYLHEGDFVCHCSKKYEGMQISLSNYAHTYILAL